MQKNDFVQKGGRRLNQNSPLKHSRKNDIKEEVLGHWAIVIFSMLKFGYRPNSSTH